MTSLSLLTYNTWKCDGDYQARLPLMVAEIDRLNPDLVFLQEAFVTPDRLYDTAGAISRCGAYQITRAEARRKERICGGVPLDSTSGLAVLSRSPRLASRIVPLPENPADGERLALIVEIQTDVGRLALVNLHLTHLSDGDNLRQHQLMAAINAIPAHRHAIVAGDFNCLPDAVPAVASRLGSHVIYGSTAAGPHCLAAGTLNPVVGSDMTDTVRCLDHVLLMGPDRVVPQVGLKNAEVVINRPDPVSGLYASDHAGVLVHLELVASAGEDR
ncbi:MAG: endonuclease/exonuclease/phosphatase family protein [Rhodospirillales bacterium]|nr:endonuclease/exonuclease/phosphatase family protein [Rhodospirillales bacterium]